MKVFSRSDALFLSLLVGLALIAGTDSALATDRDLPAPEHGADERALHS